MEHRTNTDFFMEEKVTDPLTLGINAQEKKPWPFRKPEEIILTAKDLNLALGSGELKVCPFCGATAMSSGEIINGRAGRAIRWTVQCMGSEGLIPNCFASVIAVDPDQGNARTTAVERWNRRIDPTKPISRQ